MHHRQLILDSRRNIYEKLYLKLRYRLHQNYIRVIMYVLIKTQNKTFPCNYLAQCKK